MAEPSSGRTSLIRPGTAADLAAIERIQAAAPEAAHWPAVDYLAHELWVCGPAGREPDSFAVARCVTPGEWELLNLAVSPGERRRGRGQQLLAHLLRIHPGEWFLEVRASNSGARALYEKAGFVAVGRRAGYYPAEGGANREEGIVFRFLS